MTVIAVRPTRTLTRTAPPSRIGYTTAMSRQLPAGLLTANCELSLCFPEEQLIKRVASRIAANDALGSGVGEIDEEGSR
jgi:hypothetical protein